MCYKSCNIHAELKESSMVFEKFATMTTNMTCLLRVVIYCSTSYNEIHAPKDLFLCQKYNINNNNNINGLAALCPGQPG